ncbi:MAG: hypothetical protein K8R69_04735 [Deltaproteobacteria bacterium]|nr:hypothetical protein [Deltaproteobacteria bacterium]
MFFYLKDITDTYLVETLQEAVHLARDASQKGDIIVYSPAAPPEPHLYGGFDGRGNAFIETLNQEFGLDFEKIRRAMSIQPGGIKM